MNVEDILQQSDLILAEAAITERIRREKDVELHPELFLTPLIYSDKGKKVLSTLYRQYRDVALQAEVPLLLSAPTWRNDQKRLNASGYGERLLLDAIDFMQGLRDEWQVDSSPLIFGAYLGPQNDCYSPEEALQATESEEFHSWQIERIAGKKVDCLVTQTMPAVTEALGIARASAQFNIPCIISFVINKKGEVLDGTLLSDAMQFIDSNAGKKPLGYMVNCVYPTFIHPELQDENVLHRLIGIQANASSLDHTELDGSVDLHRDDLHHWGDEMLLLNRDLGLKILGGCCGTDQNYLQYLVNQR